HCRLPCSPLSPYTTLFRSLLGFVLGRPLMSLFRPLLPGGLITSPESAANLEQTVSIAGVVATARQARTADGRDMQFVTLEDEWGDRKSTRLNSSHLGISYA